MSEWRPDCNGWLSSNRWIFPRALKHTAGFKSQLAKKNLSPNVRADMLKTLREISEGWRDVIESKERRPRPLDARGVRRRPGGRNPQFAPPDPED